VHFASCGALPPAPKSSKQRLLARRDFCASLKCAVDEFAKQRNRERVFAVSVFINQSSLDQSGRIWLTSFAAKAFYTSAGLFFDAATTSAT
jgi:hypothetical protein